MFYLPPRSRRSETNGRQRFTTDTFDRTEVASQSECFPTKVGEVKLSNQGRRKLNRAASPMSQQNCSFHCALGNVQEPDVCVEMFKCWSVCLQDTKTSPHNRRRDLAEYSE